MERKKQINLNKNNVISASEIGQYIYCSISWYLQRCGYQPDSVLLDKGKNIHIKLGNQIDKINIDVKRSNRYAFVGYLFLIIGLICVFYGVFL